MMKKTLIASALLASFSANAKSEIEHVTIFGKNNPVNTVPGSAHQLSKEDLETFKYSDIMRSLAAVPGVYLQEEEGYGLRPNVGMRGTGQNRSAKVTVMEDGVLAAPASYASPSAYYFPTAGRMERIEVMKGSSTVKYGPRTTGGVINMVSRQIPETALAGGVDAALGQDGFGKLHAHAGGQGERVGAVTEVYRYQADGFRDINAVGGDSGFVKNDVLAKMSIRSEDTAAMPQMLKVKLKYSDETSNETYIGLTEADYKASPFKRYSASQKDQMTTEHKQVVVNHAIEFNPSTNLSTTAYYNDFYRNWYKADKIGGKSLSGGGVLAAANFDKNPIGSLPVGITSNGRNYISQGIQSELWLVLGDHQLDIGIRYHEDDEDRYQWHDEYQLNEAQRLTLVKGGVPGTDANRLDAANAWSAYVQDEFTFGALTLTAGVRYEDVNVTREDWGKTNPAREGDGKQTENSFATFLPSLSATWRLNDEWLLLAGVQKGFSPAAPGNADGEEEQSWNYEAGTRFAKDELSAEAIAFYSDYSNMHGNCTASEGCNPNDIGNQYNAGEVKVKGVELSTGYEFNAQGRFSFPIGLAYTYTDSEFQNSFSAASMWGNVKAGDEFSYTPKHMVYLSAGVQTEDWQVNLVGRYSSDMRSKPGQGEIPVDQLIGAKTIVDMSARYFVTQQQELYLNIDNLLDETYIATLTHGSIFAGKPRSVMVGYGYKF